MNELYLIGNYIIINNSANPYRASNIFYKESGTEFEIYYGTEYNRDLLQKIAFVDVANWQDDNTVAYTESSLRDFLQTNTGKIGSGATPIVGSFPISPSTSSISTRPTDFSEEVALGKREGISNVNKFGYNLDLDTGSPEIIASFGGAFDPTLNVIDTAQTYTITYNATTDGDSTTGALSLLISHLASDFTIQDEIHVLGSTGTDVTAFTSLGVNRVVVISNGGAGLNVNDITFTATTDGTNQAQIPATSSVTEQLIYHTPISHTLLIDWLYFSPSGGSGGGPGSGAKIDINMFSWSRVTQTRYQIDTSFIDTARQSDISIQPPIPIVVGGREVIYVTASTDVNNTVIGGRFGGHLHENSFYN